MGDIHPLQAMVNCNHCNITFYKGKLSVTTGRKVAGLRGAIASIRGMRSNLIFSEYFLPPFSKGG